MDKLGLYTPDKLPRDQKRVKWVDFGRWAWAREGREEDERREHSFRSM